MSKLCSVIIPTHNRPQSLRLAVQSALDALPPNSEIIVVDDGSSQKACDTLHDMQSDFLVIVENDPPHGPSLARNLGISLSQGKTIFFLDDDDEFLPHYIREIVEARKKLPENCVYGFSSALKRTPTGDEPLKRVRHQSEVRGEGHPLSSRLAGLGMGFWIDLNAMNDAGGLDGNLRVNEDTELCIRLASQGKHCFYTSAPGVVLKGDDLRGQDDQSSVTKSATALTRALGFEYIVLKHLNFLMAHPKALRSFITRILKYRWRAKSIAKWNEFRKGGSASIMILLVSFVGTPVFVLRSKKSG